MPCKIPAAILCALTPITALVACGILADLDAKTRSEPSTERESTGSVASDLVGTEWVLVSLRNRALPEDAAITLKIEADDPYTKFVGDAICNGYGARNVATEKGAVEINSIESSAVGCPAVEETYYESLRDATTYRVSEGRLEMRNTAGQTTLIYQRGELPDSGGEPTGETRLRF